VLDPRRPAAVLDNQRGTRTEACATGTPAPALPPDLPAATSEIDTLSRRQATSEAAAIVREAIRRGPNSMAWSYRAGGAAAILDNPARRLRPS
jgi:hypothetical protein